MLNDNWYFFILIILMCFCGSDGLGRVETCVLLGVITALACCGGEDLEPINELEEVDTTFSNVT